MWVHSLWHKLLKIMGLKSKDSSKLIWTVLLTFVSGALLCFTSSLPIALFLSKFGSESLPSIYLAVAFMSMSFGFAYAFLERRIPFKKLVICLALVINITLTLLGTALITLDNNVIIIMLLVWCIMAYDLVEYSIWAIINTIYSMQQAKNSFGIIGGCQSMGGVVAGLLSPILVSLLGIKLLILVAGFLGLFMVFSMLVLLKIGHQPNDNTENHNSEEEEDTSETLPTFKEIKRNKYILKIFSLSILAVFVLYTVDLAFNTAAEAHYPNSEDLAAFLGVFFGLIDGVDLIISVSIFSWITRRLGIVISLFVLPTIGLVISMPIMIMCNIPILVHVVFWIVIGLKLWEEGCRTSITEMSSLLLLQPFPCVMRSYIQSKLDSIILGLSTAIISIVLMILTKTIGASIGVLSLMIICFFGLIISILLTMKQDYIETVRKAIAGHFWERSNTFKLSKEDLMILEEYLKSNYPDEVIYALHCIEEIDKAEFLSSLNFVFKNTQDNTVKELLINKISEYKLEEYYPELRSLLSDHNNGEQIQISALRAAAHIEYEPIKEFVLNYTASDILKLASNALIITLNMEKDPEINALARNKVTALAKSAYKIQRVEAAFIISKVRAAFDSEIDLLCNDKELVVLDKIFYAVLVRTEKQFYPALIDIIAHLSINLKFIKELEKNIDVLLPIIKTKFKNNTQSAQLKIVYLLMEINHHKVHEFLQQQALDDFLPLRKAALHALTHCTSPFKESFKVKIHKLIISETKYLALHHQQLVSLPDDEEIILLTDLIKLKINHSLERLLFALSIYYDKKNIHKVHSGIQTNDEDELNYAIELLDSTLDNKHKKILSPLFIFMYLTEKPNSQEIDNTALHNVLKSYLTTNDALEGEKIMSLSYIASAYVVVKKSIKHLDKEVENLKKLNNPLVNDTLSWLDSLRM